MLRQLALMAACAAATAAAPSGSFGQSCAGDCNGDGHVAVNELVLGVAIALGRAPASACPAIDVDGNATVEVNELIAGVGAGTCGCGGCPTRPPVSNTATPSSTPTPTATPAAPTATPPIVGTVLFSEGWQRSRVGRYRPRSDAPFGGDVIAGDSGDWVVGDTVSQFPEDCGDSPHSVEIVNEGDGKRLRLHSADSGSECADNVEVGAITRNPPMLRGLDVDLREDIFLSFRATGELFALDACDAVYLVLELDQADRLVYILQRGAGWAQGSSACTSILTRNFILLDPDESEHVRNVLADAAALDLHRPTRVTSISLGVDSNGSATFDDIRFFRARSDQPTPTNTRTPTRTPTPKPCTCARVKTGKWCLEFGGSPIEGPLSQSGCTLTFTDASVRGRICDNTWIVDNERYDVQLRCDFSGGNPATACRGSATVRGNRVSLVGSAGGC